MKVLLLNDSLSKGGKERRMIELIKGLLKISNVHIELVIFKDSIEYPEIHDLGITFHIIERKPKRNPVTFLKLFNICKQLRPDVIHAWSSMCAIFAFPSVKLLNIKLINGNIANAPHNLSIWKKDLFRAKLTFLFSDVVVGNSEAGLSAYRAPKSKSISIPNGFDFNRVKKIESVEQVREKYKVKTRFVIGKIAAFANRKDYDTYISAAHKIIQKRDDVTFFAIGNGPNFELVRKAVPINSRNKIVFTGDLLDVESIINIFDIGILCTNIDVHGEGISNSILEYMALGKPVIATKGGGTNEIVKDGETGFLIPPKSTRSLVNNILELLDNPFKRERMGMAGKRRVDDHFNLEKMTSKYFKLYNRLIDNELKIHDKL